MKIGLFLAFLLAAAPCGAETTAGIARLQDTSQKTRPLSLSVWYPSTEQVSADIGGNPVLKGVPAAPDAPLPDGPLPLVVVSHGGLRSAADSGAWLGSAIARAGYVAVEVNAPRPGNGAAALDEIWQRPQDIRRAIDAMLADDAWAPRVDAGRVSIVGVSLGGTAALAVAGAGMDVAQYMGACAPDRVTEGPDCDWYAAQGVDLSGTDQTALAGVGRDGRVSSVIAVNPEYLPALGAAPAGVDVLLIALGNPDRATGRDQTAQKVVMPTASAFDAFAVCTDAGPGILMAEDGDASLCGGPRDARQAVHQAVSRAIISFLDAQRG